MKSNVVAAFAVYQLHRLPLIQRIVWLPFFLLNIPLYLVLDAIDRALFNRVFYRSYRGIQVDEREAMAAYVHDNYLQPRCAGTPTGWQLWWLQKMNIQREPSLGLSFLAVLPLHLNCLTVVTGNYECCRK